MHNEQNTELSNKLSLVLYRVFSDTTIHRQMSYKDKPPNATNILRDKRTKDKRTKGKSKISFYFKFFRMFYLRDVPLGSLSL